MDKRCEDCEDCIYIEHGDQYCDLEDSWKLVFNNHIPTDNYMWCREKEEAAEQVMQGIRGGIANWTDTNKEDLPEKDEEVKYWESKSMGC